MTDQLATAIEETSEHILEQPPETVEMETRDDDKSSPPTVNSAEASGEETAGGDEKNTGQAETAGMTDDATDAESLDAADVAAGPETADAVDDAQDAEKDDADFSPAGGPGQDEGSETVADAEVSDDEGKSSPAGADGEAEEKAGRTALRLMPPTPDYDAADQFDSLEGQTFLAMPVQVTPSPEAALFVATELAERTHIVETAARDDAPAPISAAPLWARPIREAAIQIIQTGKPPFPIKPKVEDQTALVPQGAARSESDSPSEERDEAGEATQTPAAPAEKKKEPVPPPLSAPLGNPLEPTRRAIAPIAAEKTFIAQPLPVDGTWYDEHQSLVDEYDQYEEEPAEVTEIEIEGEFPDEDAVEPEGEGDNGPARVVLPEVPPPLHSLGISPGLAVACFSPGLMKIPNLEAFLGHALSFQPATDSGVGAAVTWGGKDNLAARRAMMFARKYNLPLWRLEDGFLRSLDLGSRGSAPMSLVADQAGIYYDANRPSDLENLLNSTGWETPELLAAADKAIRLIKEESLSKYNLGRPAPEGTITGGKRGRRRILVLDQTRGDLSVSLGLGGPETFQAMLKAARYEHPGEEFFIKTHPEVIAGKKQGYFDLRRQTGLTVIGEDYSPLSLIAQADEVYTVTSQMGLEALFLEKTVHCFGLPFYAGWGLTKDRLATARRTRERTLSELFAAAYILYPRYVNPITGRSADVFEIIRLLTDQRRHHNATRGFWAVSGFSWWKHDHAKAFFGSAESKLSFALTSGHARFLAKRKHARIAAWSTNFYQVGDLNSVGGSSDIPEIIRVEDGFLRSAGLGSDYRTPYSLILDPEGIYYDCSRPSRLERLLAEFDFNEHQELVARAGKLIQAIVDRNLSKYGRVGERNLNFKLPDDRRVILVPGQVETDASITYGSPQISTNAALLAEVRGARPEAFIIYKPHPDVERGNRLGEVPDHLTAKLADRVAAETDLAALLPKVHEVHTMTSLAGFEALIRGLEVHTYGGPFYAGWKLTVDRLEFPRRGRRLTVNELAAAVLILYPTYYDWGTKLFCGPEEIIHILSRDEAPPSMKIKLFMAVRDLVRKWSKGKYGGPR